MELEWKGKALKTWSEICDAILKIDSKEDASELRAKIEALGPHALENVGYFSGYYSNDAARKILTTIKTHHPVFGQGWPDNGLTASDAFKLGIEMGASARLKNIEDKI